MPPSLYIPLVVLTLVVIPRPAAACSCVRPGPPCDAFPNASAVFVGKVTEIAEVARTGTSQPLDGRRVRFEVLEAFSGVPGAAIDVHTGWGGGDCGYDFRTGRRYLVYAFRAPEAGGLTTGICSRTRPLEDAEEDLSYLRTRNDPARGAGIEGYAFRLKRDARGDTSWGSFAEDVELVVETDGGSWELATGKEGRFALWGLAPGKYRLRGRDPGGDIVSIAPDTFALLPRGCIHATVMLTPERRPQCP